MTTSFHHCIQWSRLVETGWANSEVNREHYMVEERDENGGGIVPPVGAVAFVLQRLEENADPKVQGKRPIIDGVTTCIDGEQEGSIAMTR